MIVIAATAESGGETRVALSPETVKKFKSLGADVRLQSKAGRLSNFTDQAYSEAGATIAATAEEALKDADIVLKVGARLPKSWQP